MNRVKRRLLRSALEKLTHGEVIEQTPGRPLDLEGLVGKAAARFPSPEGPIS